MLRTTRALFFIVFSGVFADAASASTMLTVHTEIGSNKALYLCGSGDGLSWDPNSALKGIETPASSGAWVFNLSDGNSRGTVQAKIFISDRAGPSANPVWMSGKNFILQLNQNNNLSSVGFEFPAGQITLHTLSVRGLTSTHQIRIYIPPPTEASSLRKLPVVYALDGQTLFNSGAIDVATWNLNTTMDDQVGRGLMRPVIVVGIDAATDRLNEYSYIADPTRPGEPGGGGEVFAKETIPDIVNWIEKSSGLPVEKTTASRTLLGSSLGGLEAMYIGLTAGGTSFATVLSLSGSYWWKDDDFSKRLPELIKSSALPAVYLSMGTDEGANASDQAQAMEGARSLNSALIAQGYSTQKNYQYLEIPGASHDSASWSIRMQQLFPEVFPAILRSTPQKTSAKRH
jgi:enterochelin esterase-like enzyme